MSWIKEQIDGIVFWIVVGAVVAAVVVMLWLSNYQMGSSDPVAPITQPPPAEEQPEPQTPYLPNPYLHQPP